MGALFNPDIIMKTTGQLSTYHINITRIYMYRIKHPNCTYEKCLFYVIVFTALYSNILPLFASSLIWQSTKEPTKIDYFYSTRQHLFAVMTKRFQNLSKIDAMQQD